MPVLLNNISVYFLSLVCVLAISVGQIVFKLASIELDNSGNFFSFKVILYVFFALILYGLSSIAWIYLLQKIELSKMYPLMALAFVFVPLFSFLVLNEKISLTSMLGSIIIIVGVYVASM